MWRRFFSSSPGGVIGRPLQAWVTRFVTGERVGIVSLNQRIFGCVPRLDILQRVIVWQLAKRRAGTAKVKDRSEVRGGGRKPWPQKGLGRARQGSIRAPHFRGGGVVHGPRGPKSYDYALPKKVRCLGMCTALSIKYGQGDLYIVDDLSMDNHKTKDIIHILNSNGWKSVLLVDGGDTVNLNVALAGKNVQELDTLPIIGLNPYSIIQRDALVLTLGGVRLLEERLSGVLQL